MQETLSQASATWLREIYADKAARAQPTLVLFSQVYVPDPAAVGQYMHQAAAAMVQRGYRVIAFAADSGYEDPAQRFPRYERMDGVHVVRLPFSSFAFPSPSWYMATNGSISMACCQAS